MIRETKSRYLVPFRGRFALDKQPTRIATRVSEDALEARLAELADEIGDLQRRLTATDRHAVLLVFQGLDAAGKDGMIRALTQGVDASGCTVTSFKVPSAEELDHDFLWRIHERCPARGTIGVFNRSQYESVLVVRVSAAVLAAERLPGKVGDRDFWNDRLESIRDFEHHLARNGTVIRKFWLHVSADEQARRLLDRVRERKSHWKFSEGDLEKRRQRGAYLAAAGEALAATSRAWAPWYSIPADDKDAARVAVAEIVLATLQSMKLEWPKPGPEDVAAMRRVETALLAELRKGRGK